MTFLAESYVHGLDPFLIRFTETIGLRWYGLAYLGGFVVAWLGVWWLARSGRSTIPRDAVADLMVYVLVGVVVGGRLGYCLFYDQSLLIEFTSTFPWWGLLAIHKGGMASHGGMIGVILACWLYARRHEISKLHLLDVATLASTPGLFFGRLANFINAELWGKPLPASMRSDPPWWSIKYPQEIEDWHMMKQVKLAPAVDAAGINSAE